MPRDIEDWDNFVRKLAQRYKGRIRVYELWNEPEHDAALSPQDIATLARRATVTIRSIDPAAKIATPSLNGRHADWAAQYFAAGGTTDVDVVSLHTYTPTQANWPETIDPRYKGSAAIFGPIWSVIVQHGLAQKPLWSTEGAWSDRPNSLPDPNDQAAFVARALLLHWSTGFTRFYWYAYDHASIGRLVDTRAGDAYRSVRKWMEGARMTELCGPIAAGSEIWRCGLKRSNQPEALVIWSTGAEKSVEVPIYLTEAVGIDGDKIRVDQQRLTVGKIPKLLIQSGAAH
jgi:hypothetical protein